MKRIACVAALFALPFAVLAQSVQLTEGEVRKVDKEAGKITLKHGPIQNLGMPAMTMVFQVKEESVLDKVKPGQKVRFAAEDIKGNFTVTHIEAAKPRGQ